MEEAQRAKLYEYKANSNLVLEADRDVRRRADEATGEVESLVGKMDTVRMGSRLEGRPSDLTEKIDKARVKRAREEASEAQQKKKRTNKNVFIASAGSTVLTETEDLDTGTYRPKTRESRVAYEEVLAMIRQSYGDQPHEILRSAADEILAILKTGTMKDPEKQREVEKLLQTSMNAQKFNKLVNLGKSIKDFRVEGGVDKDEEKENKLDDEMGVAVVFDEDDDEFADGVVDEVREADEEDDEDGVDTERGQGLKGQGQEEDMEVEDKDALKVHDIDAHWLQRGLSKYYDDANVSSRLAEEVLQILAIPDERDCENKLVVLLNYDKFEFIRVLLHNRSKVYYCTRLKQAQTDDEKREIEAEMREDTDGKGPEILDQLYHQTSAESWVADRTAEFARTARKEARALKGPARVNSEEADDEALPYIQQGLDTAVTLARTINLDTIAFADGGHFRENRQCTLPEGAWKAQKKGYVEVHVPPIKANISQETVRIASLPEWAQAAFEGQPYDRLNVIQSKMLETALYTAENILLCSPTGSGKTNVALLCMLNTIGNYRDKETGVINLDAFKIVYIAPMKALVQENVASFSKRLAPFGMTVNELSGDSSLSRQQIQETHVIVTTPEKWDIITRKVGDRTYTQLVRLIIIDEIHLLHDDRGPVLETIVARTHRQVEATQEMVRMVGLSATLPNYEHVATFLRVNHQTGLFFFDNSYRPIPLHQQYIGITEKKALKRFQLMNEICFEKSLECAGKHQVLIFVHSRAETAKTAKALRDMAIERDVVEQFVPEGATKEILMEQVADVKNGDLAEVLPYGFGIHHAGMARADRTLVEDLFGDRQIQVLVSTATLAWGVNLPAHTVIIKGTQMYNPEQGKWTELSPLDIMQMLGRAGRPGFDSQGEGIIITQHTEMQFYMSVMNTQLTVESQMIKRLPDMLNAEVVAGSVNTVRDAARWLVDTYLYVRMTARPDLYGVPASEVERGDLLLQHRIDVAHSAALMLDKHNLVKYDRKSGVLQMTALGRVASYYYISHESMAVYNEHLKPTMSDIEIFRLFSLSGEFRQIHVREEEKLELQKLVVRVPIPIKEGIDEPSAKVNVLLQAYISRLKLEGFALVADMAYIQQSATRIMRALFEISQKRGWAALADKTLTISKMIERRLWQSQSPLRQFPKCPEKLISKLEKNSDLTWDRYYDLKPADLGELVRVPKVGKALHKLIHTFPKLILDAHVQPITRSLIRVELSITPDFHYQVDIHEHALLFWIVVEDVTCEKILHYEAFMLKAQYALDEHIVTFSVPIFDPLPPQYFIRVVSDRWLHSTAILPVSFKHLILPHKYPPPTELLDLQPLPVSALGNKRFQSMYTQFQHFNAIQTQTYTTLYESDDNVLICAPTGSGKTICAEFGLLRMFKQDDIKKQALMSKKKVQELEEFTPGKCVYIACKAEIVDTMFDHWVGRFGADLDKQVVRLTGETAADTKLLAAGDVICCTSEEWDAISRRWRGRVHVQNVALYIFDELHLVGGTQGPTLEVVVSRARYVASQLGKTTRIVGLASSMANAKDVGDWMGVTHQGLFNFSPDVRPVPLELRLHGLDINHFSSRILAMSQPVYNTVSTHARPGKPAIVFVPSRSQAQLTAIDIMTYASSSGSPGRFLNIGAEDPSSFEDRLNREISEAVAVACVCHGVAYVHEGMLVKDRNSLMGLWRDGVVSVLVAPHSMCWSIPSPAHLVVVMGTEYYEGKEHRYIDYPVPDILQMMGLASRPLIDDNGVCVCFCHTPKKEHLRKLLHDPLPVESHLDRFLHDNLCAEVVNKTVENKQDAVDYMTWTLFYRRLTQNPNYYNLAEVSHRHLSDHLSELVENTITDLETSKCLSVEEDPATGAHVVTPLNLGMIAAFYYIKYTTIEIFASSVKEKTKVKGLLEILSASTEFAHMTIRHNEEKMLEKLAKHTELKTPQGVKFSDVQTKISVLLQCHFSRQELVQDLRTDLQHALKYVIRLLQAFVDVISSCGWLKPALGCMELSQMCVQGMWATDSPLLQLPHFTREIVERCKNHPKQIESVFDIIDFAADDPDALQELLQFSPKQMSDVAVFCNQYPSIELTYELNGVSEGSVISGDLMELDITLTREVDEADEANIGHVVTSRYPHEKFESWWLCVGDVGNNAVLAIKRLVLRKQTTVQIQFNAPEVAGDYTLSVYLMCDSYLGCDQEYTFPLTVLSDEGQEPMDEEA